MEEERSCIACGAHLMGPFEPTLGLTRVAPKGEPESELLDISVSARACPGCGLVHWYVDDQDLDKLLDAALPDEAEPAKPGTSYERRTQMLRMLRRVRRM
jgi:hypothetical protein